MEDPNALFRLRRVVPMLDGGEAIAFVELEWLGGLIVRNIRIIDGRHNVYASPPAVRLKRSGEWTPVIRWPDGVGPAIVVAALAELDRLGLSRAVLPRDFEAVR